MTAFAIADNRTAELAEWDDPVLAAQLESLRADGIDLDEIGFDNKAVQKLLDAAGAEGDGAAGTGAGESGEQWMVVVTCRDEADQAAMLEQMQSQGRECRALLG